MAESGLRAVRDELAAAVSTISRISQDLSVNVAKANGDAASMRTRVAELEAERSSMLLRLQAMETRNEELCARLEQSQPELARATRARDAAVKKLRLMRDVVRDLIDERRVAGTAVHAGRSHQSEQADHRRSNGGNSESSSGESWDSLQLTDVGAESSMSEDVHVVPEVSKPSTPLPRRTLVLSDASNQSAPSRKRSPKITEEIPPARRGGTASSWRGTVSTNPTKLEVAEQKPGSEEHPVKVAHCGPSRSSRHNSKGGRVVRIQRQPKQMNGLGGLGDGVDDPTKDASDTQPAGPVTMEIGWYLEYRHPPATALRPRGPVSYASLGVQLSARSQMLRIESLESLGAPSMQIHVYRDMAFVCHPVVLTTGTERPIDAIFQLFIRTMGQDAAWYYLGAHKLLAVDVPSVWHTRLRDEEKRELVAGLEERWTWRDAPNAERIAHLIETGELGQCTVELESKGLEERSQAFAGRYLSRK